MQSESASTQQGSGTKKTGRKSIDEKDENAAAAACSGIGADDAHQRPAGQRHGGGTDAV
jgi:hypothetical protein